MTSPYLTAAEAADYLRFTGPHALKSLRRFLRAQQVPYKKRGPHGDLLISRIALEEALVNPYHSRPVLRRA